MNNVDYIKYQKSAIKVAALLKEIRELYNIYDAAQVVKYALRDKIITKEEYELIRSIYYGV